MNIRIVLALVLIACFASLLFCLHYYKDRTLPENPGQNGELQSTPLVLTESSQCKTCHPAVYSEWKQSWHAKAWKDPLVREKSENFTKKDCIPCHAPRPVFERGIRKGDRVVERISNRDDGIDCFSCHRLPDGGFAASSRTIQGPCGPVYHPKITTVDLCVPCHNQHNTVDEWRVAPPKLKGENCGACHMPIIEREGSGKRPPKMGRDHTFPGGHSEKMIKSAFSLSHKIKNGAEEKRLYICLKNDKSGHNFPTDSRHRAVDLVVTFYDRGGIPLPAIDEEREYGQEPGTFRMRFRNPYRSESGKVNTQIPAGKEAVMEKAIPEEAVRAKVELLFKLTPYELDSEAKLLIKEDIKF